MRTEKDDVVPLSRLSEIVNFASSQLEDKSSLVRKMAIQLIKLFLEELEQRYEAKRKQLSDLRMKMNDESDKQEGR